jgi:hypothetical protein
LVQRSDKCVTIHPWCCLSLPPVLWCFNELSFYNVESLPTIEATHYTVWIGGSLLADKEAACEVVFVTRSEIHIETYLDLASVIAI